MKTLPIILLIAVSVCILGLCLSISRKPFLWSIFPTADPSEIKSMIQMSEEVGDFTSYKIVGDFFFTCPNYIVQDDYLEIYTKLTKKTKSLTFSFDDGYRYNAVLNNPFMWTKLKMKLNSLRNVHGRITYKENIPQRFLSNFVTFLIGAMVTAIFSFFIFIFIIGFIDTKK